MKKAESLFKIICYIAVTFGICFVVFSGKIYAVTVTLSDVPTTITSDPFTLTASVSGAQAGINYLKIDLFKEGTINYFGETNTPLGWYGGSEGVQTYPITIINNAPWSGQIQGRLGNPSITQFDGTGTYKLRVRRYTSSGSSSTASDPVTVAIAVPTQTPTPTITPTPTNEPTPTRTPTPTKNPTPIPDDEESDTITPTKSNKKISPTSVLGESTQSAIFEIPTATPIETPPPTVSVKGIESSANIFPLFFIAGGSLLLLSYGILMLAPWLKKIWKRE